MCILFDKEDRYPFFIDLLYRSEYFGDHYRRKTERWLIEEEYLRFRHKRPAYCKHLLLAATQCPPILPGPLLKYRKQPEYVFEHYRKIAPSQESTHLQVLKDSQFREYPPSLRNLAYPHLNDFMRSHCGYGGPVYHNVS